MMNLRTTIARLVNQFDFGFAQGEDGADFTGKATENVAAHMGDLMVTFVPRGERKSGDVG
jgi:hypothetical protein